jgi:peptidoglycan hydrolase-like protein with peptidoglycan-binding domain
MCLIGPATSAALKRFQKRYGIPATGALGPITKAKILELIQ